MRFQPRSARIVSVRRLFALGCAAIAFVTSAFAQQMMTITLAGTAGSRGTVDGVGPAARFEFPAAIAVDAQGNAYVADQNHSVIRKITPAGLVTTLAGSPGQIGSANGQGSAARFAFPENIAVDAQGNVYVSESYNAVVRKITPAGLVSTFAGVVGQRGAVDGPGTSALFQAPFGMAFDAAGNLFVADVGGCTIRKITPAGVVSTFAGTAMQNGSGRTNLDGVGADARFGAPCGIAIDAAGNLFVTDRAWKLIRKITPSAVVTTIAGSIQLGGVLQNGTGTNAGFREPGGIAIDPASNLYVLETNTQLVRRVTPAGVVTTLMGEFLLSGSADGPDSVVRFNLPTGIASDTAGNLYIADSANFTIRKRLTVFPPVFTAQPQAITANAGQSATFTVQTTGTPAATYQWRKNGVAIPGATSATFTLSNLRAEDAGSFSVLASNIAGSTASASAQLTINPAPVITAQPASQTVNDGQTLVLRTELANPSGATFRWMKNGIEILGANEATLTLRNLNPSDAGNYHAVVTNAAGSVTTNVALVTVLSSRFVNLSVRNRAGSATAALIVGFVVSGDAKPLLIRGDGAVLAQYNVSGALTDPVLTVYRDNVVVATNDDWSSSPNAASIADMATRVSAFPLPNPSRDAALLSTLAGGGYTAHVFASNNVPGIALTELYDANPLGAGRLVNLSARGRVEGGDNTLIAGFVIAGNTKKRLLVRGIGPGLTGFGVDDVLANPRVSIFQNAIVPLATNDDWTTDVAASAASVGAFPLVVGSRDAALVLSLDPGAYTAQVAGVGDTTGNALVEIYELP